MGLIESTPVIAFGILICMMFIGDLISHKTKAYVPALLVFVVLLLIGVWGGMLPKNIIEIPGFTSSFANYIILIFLVDMGTSISIGQFIKQWKVVVVSLCTLVGSSLVILTLGRVICGYDTAIIAAPTVAGGFVAVLQMTQAAVNAGKEHLATLPALIFVLHSFPAYLAFPYSVKKQGDFLLKDFRAGKVKNVSDINAKEEGEKVKLVDKIPASLKTSAFFLGSLSIFAMLAFFTSMLIKNAVAPTVFGLLFGIAGRHFGILEVGSMKKSNSSGYLMFGAMISIFTSLANTNPSDIISALASLVILIILGLIGISIGSILCGKALGFSASFSFAIGLNALLGFPMNFMLTTEAVNAVCKTDEERKYITNQIMPSMLVAGFVCITIGSTIFASVMATFL